MISELDHIIQKAEVSYLNDSGDNLRLKAQMLIDLGYLEKAFLMNAVSESQVHSAMIEFRKDLDGEIILSKADISAYEKVYATGANAKLLEKMVDVDEGLQFDKLPAFGDQNLQTRILHYRLNLLGLYDGRVAAAWSALSYTALEKAAVFAGQLKQRTMNLLADLEAYTAAVLKKTGYKNPLLVFESDPHDKIPEYTGAFKRHLKQNLEKHKNVFDALDDALFFRRDKKVNMSYLSTLKHSETNRFLLRLIQVHQWMAGVYDGVLDGEYGAVTLESLLDVISHYNDEDREHVKTDKLLVRIAGNMYLFNAVHFLISYSHENLSADRTFDTLQVLSESVSGANPDDQQLFEQNFQSEVALINSGESSIPESRNGFLPRLFTGVKTFFKKLFRFAKKLFKWIVEQAQKAIQFVRNVVRMIYSFLKEAVIHFINGVKFLLGKLPVNSIKNRQQGLFTQFDIDKDAVNIALRADEGLIMEHIRRVNQTVGSMQFSLQFIVFLFTSLKSAVLAPVPIAWPLFILKMVYSFKKVIEKYKLINT